MKFTTQSGSIYEVNTNSKQIRRLEGKENPTPRQGPDGQWKTYHSLCPSPIEVGTNVIIVWGENEELLEETKEFMREVGNFPATPTTMTSIVVSIECPEEPN